MEEYDAHPQQGGGGTPGVHLIFKGRGVGGAGVAGGAALRIGYLGDHPLHGQGSGGVSGPGGDTVDGTAPAEDTGREVEIHFGGNGKGGYGVLDNGGINQEAQEHGRTVYCYAITVRPV